MKKSFLILLFTILLSVIIFVPNVRAVNEDSLTETNETYFTDLSEVTVNNIASRVYTGEYIRPDAVIKDGTKRLCGKTH